MPVIANRNTDGKVAGRHGLSHTKVYEAWHALVGRCNCKTNKAYADYGGRGITVCDRWLLFDNFLEDMGFPEPDQALDRIDNSAGYYPGNCRWTTYTVNNRNRRSNVVLEFNGESKCIAAWSETTGLPFSTIHSRLKYGWSIERILTTPKREMIYVYENYRK